MSEFYVVTTSFAAPFFSDTDSQFVEGGTPREALERAVREYTHPAGLYAATLYRDANASAKGEKPLAQWLSNHERALRTATAGKRGYSYLGHAPGDFEIDRRRFTIPDPKGGSVTDDRADD